MDTIVALDLETTGLDPTRDAIIEIGCVRFQGDRVEDEWSTLVNPGRPIPIEVVRLTGIDDSMVANAPRFSQVQEDLSAFVEDCPILGHAIGFDLSFLQRLGLFRENPAIDTYALASVVLPKAARYSLVGLANELGVPLKSAHRALDDAYSTMRVFQRLYQRVLDFPATFIEDIVRLTSHLDWGAAWIFEDALDQLLDEAPEDIQIPREPWFRWAELPSDVDPLSPAEEYKRLDAEELASILEPGGAFAKAFPGYEHRSQQVRMLQHITEALSSGNHLLVEAGTGTGKSMAYLIPAFEYAVQNGRRVVISTNTINLQDQLIHKDIPDLQKILPTQVRAAVLKGRTNYLCPRAFNAMLRLGPNTKDEMRVLAKLMVWLLQGGSGDVNEISLRGPAERAIWTRLSSASEDCSMDSCLRHMGGVCPYYRARQAADSSHVIIINHALLLADIATGNRVIPEFDHLIVDEAHHLESATTQGLSFQVTQAVLDRALRDLSNTRSGSLSRIQAVARQNLPPDLNAPLERTVEAAMQRAQECLQLNERFFDSLLSFMERQREDKPLSVYGQQERVLPSTRTLPIWNNVEMIWDDYRRPLDTMVKALRETSEAMTELADSGLDAVDDLAVATRNILRVFEDVVEHLDEMIFESDPGKIYWISLPASGNPVTLHAAPLDVGPLVERFLWHTKESVIMTSATLTTSGEFDYIRQRLRALDADELALGSPFDYESSTLLYLLNDIPEPQERVGYQKAVEKGLIQLGNAIGGRTLALFTSNQQLRQTANAINQPLASRGITVLEQTSGASRHALLEAFRDDDSTMLLGTRSFWEGVDVPGEALSALALIRLPFDVPSDPIVAARSETFENPFDQYSIPEAILRFRQGFGRLIRTRSDRGVVVCFDRRLLTKRYGRAFIDSLPRCTLKTGPLNRLAEESERWLGL
jgi:DNA polymerase-3 subunit epsilon/ATP-dependent DNA helicase DinG